jgi:tRNA threonylcarbamoyladenosine biosynthesis protein TsaE
MSNAMTLVIKSINSTNTEQIAEQIGKNLKGGELIELISDLGGGKTMFVKGLAKGAASDDLVSSPTFTISKLYKCPYFDIRHFDFYRLVDPGIVSLELEEFIDDKKVVTIIEWADIVRGVLPEDRLKINIEIIGDYERMLHISYPEKFNYLLEGLK